jgi:hypothetical protein
VAPLKNSILETEQFVPPVPFAENVMDAPELNVALAVGEVSVTVGPTEVPR